MSFKHFDALKKRVQGKRVKSIAVAAAEDAHALASLKDLLVQIKVRYFLVGNREQIKQICQDIAFDVEERWIVDAVDEVASAAKAVALVVEGKADIRMRGKLHTAILLKAVLHKETGIQTGGLISHLAVLECPSYHKLMFLTDAVSNPTLDLDEKRAMLENTVSFMHQLGYERPNVAALAAVETVSDRMPETLDAAELAKQNWDGEITGCYVEGPISFDLAVSRQAAAIKGFSSELVGEVDLFLMPNISSGNAMSKALLYLGGAKMAGCVLGAKVPIVLTSRGATAEEKFLSLLLAMAV